MSEGHPLVDPGHPLRWVVPLLVCLAGGLILDGLISAPTFKTVVLALLGAVLFFPTAALSARDAAAAWFPSAPGRLLLLSVALGALAARHGVDAGGLRDALLAFGLANLAALFGLRALEHTPDALQLGLAVLGALVGGVCVLQAAGVGLGLSPDATEVVGLAGNSTRAGALLAVCFVAGAAALAGGRAEGRVDAPDSRRAASAPLLRWSSSWPRLLLLLVTASGLLLTRARGARLAALVALLVLGALSWWRARHPARSERAADAAPTVPPRRVLGALLGVVFVAFAVTHFVGGPAAVRAEKLPADGALLDGTDLTANVRLALWASTLDMIVDAPLGHGLGNFARAFPAYRDPLEAALPGLAGAATYAAHPHNELLLWTAEGGLLAGLLMLLLVVLTARRGVVRVLHEGTPSARVALAVFVAALVCALLQDALVDPGTALPFWVAVGMIWAPRPAEARAWWLGSASTGVFLALLGIALGVLAWPRLDAELSLRSALLRYEDDVRATTERIGSLGATTGLVPVSPEVLALVERAVDATPRDVEILSFALLFAERARDEALARADTEALVEIVLLLERVQAALASAQAPNVEAQAGD